MDPLINVVTLGKITADYMRRLKIKIEPKKTFSPNFLRGEKGFFRNTGTSSVFRGKKPDKIQHKDKQRKTKIKS